MNDQDVVFRNAAPLRREYSDWHPMPPRRGEGEYSVVGIRARGQVISLDLAIQCIGCNADVEAADVATRLELLREPTKVVRVRSISGEAISVYRARVEASDGRDMPYPEPPEVDKRNKGAVRGAIVSVLFRIPSERLPDSVRVELDPEWMKQEFPYLIATENSGSKGLAVVHLNVGARRP
jgi:hypothetical protein